MAQDGGTRGGTFHGEMDRLLQRKSGLDYGMQFVVVVVVVVVYLTFTESNPTIGGGSFNGILPPKKGTYNAHPLPPHIVGLL